MLPSPRRWGNCVNLKVRSMHPSNTSGGLGLSRSVETRYKKMLKRDYKGFKTDEGTERQKLPPTTQKFRKMYPAQMPNPCSEISKATKPSSERLSKKIYNRGLAAWRTGHRPGASPQAWGYARVHSFATKGKTYYTADKDLRT